MKKWVAYLILLAFILGGALYLEDTLALEGTTNPGGITMRFVDRKGESINGVTLLPAVYGDDFLDPDANTTETISIKRSTIADWGEVPLWKETLINGARDHFLLITNSSTPSAPCTYRTYIAFENNGGVFDKQIVVSWNHDDFTISELPDDLTIAGDQNVYRVFQCEPKQSLAHKATAIPMYQLYMKREADNADVAALKGEFTVRAVTTAVWQQSDTEQNVDWVDQLGTAGIGQARRLFEETPADNTPSAQTTTN